MRILGEVCVGGRGTLAAQAPRGTTTFPMPARSATRRQAAGPARTLPFQGEARS